MVLHARKMGFVSKDFDNGNSRLAERLFQCDFIKFNIGLVLEVETEVENDDASELG